MEKGCTSQLINAKPARTLHVSWSKRLTLQVWLLSAAPSMLLIQQPAPTTEHLRLSAAQLGAKATTHQVGGAVVPACLFPALWHQKNSVGIAAAECNGDVRGKARGEMKNGLLKKNMPRK